MAACGGKAVFDTPQSSQGGAPAVTTSSTTVTTTPAPPTTTSTSSSSTTSSSSQGGSGGQPPIGGAPPIPPLVEIDLGDVVFGTPVPFALPKNALGFSAIATAATELDDIGFIGVASPTPIDIIKYYEMAGSAVTWLDFSVITTAVPLSDHGDAMPLLAGKWDLVLDSQTTNDMAHLSVWYRQTVDGLFHGGVIDVNAYLSFGVAPESYVSELVHGALDGYAGLKVGKLTFLPLDAKFDIVDEENAFELMKQTAQGPGKPAINVMIVKAIETESQPLGFSSGIPGNPLQHGTFRSAVVMTVTGDPALDKLVMAHEAGHYAGLIHTSEVSGGFGDVLSDTPYCDDVIGKYDACPDFNNLMFPYAHPDSTLILSAKQEVVLQASAIYRGAVEAGGGFAPSLPQEKAGGDSEIGGKGQPFGFPGLNLMGPARPDWKRSSAWKALISPGAAKLLSGLWCGHTSATDQHRGLRAAGASAAALLAVGLDVAAPLHVRARALAATGTFKPVAGILDKLTAVVLDRAQSRSLRVAALRGVRMASKKRAAQLRVVDE